MIHPNQFMGKYIVKGKIHCDTGLHIGGSDTGIEIGGVDNPVIKDPITDQPYIPGSSLKGKLRAMMEWSLGLIGKHPKHSSFSAYHCHELQEDKDNSKDKERWEAAYALARLFGAATDDEQVRTQAGPTRLTVRDVFLNLRSVEKLERELEEGIYTEIKTENSIDRVTSEATPRPIERVPAGTDFDFMLIVDIYQKNDQELLNKLFSSLALLEDSGLGGGVSRGHGQISFRDIEIICRPREYYLQGKNEKVVQGTQGKSVRDLTKQDFQEF